MEIVHKNHEMCHKCNTEMQIEVGAEGTPCLGCHLVLGPDSYHTYSVTSAQ